VSLLQQGRLPLRIGSDPVLHPNLTADEDRMAREMISMPGAVFVAHTPANEFFSGANARLTALAQQHGYSRQSLATICDRNGRPVFEISRFHQTGWDRLQPVVFERPRGLFLRTGTK
jgi:hypothetical protein